MAKLIEISDKCIPAHWQPGLLIEFMIDIGINHHKLLASSGVFYEDVVHGEKNFSPSQYIKIIEKALLLYPGKDLGFRLAPTLLPGSFGDYSHALNSTSNAYEVMQVLEMFSLHIAPLLSVQYAINERTLSLQLDPAFGPNGAQQCILEAYCLAIKNYCRSRSGKKFPWSFEFNIPEPDHLEHYEVNLSEALKFSYPSCRISLPIEYAYQNWKNGSPLSFQRYTSHAFHGSAKPNKGVTLITAVKNHLIENITARNTLECTAQHFNMSSATLKRKLKRHNTSYQQLLDQSRFEVSVTLYQEKGLSSEDIAKTLGYFDIANFKRSFRRWSGENPRNYLMGLSCEQLCKPIK